MKILVLDNYDSFVYNLVQYVGEQGAKPLVYRNDAITIKEIRKLNPDGIIISPGPGTPEKGRDIGVCIDAIREFASNIPILGVCLGHQAIAHAFGGKIIQAKKVMHGKTSEIKHSGSGIFKGVKNPLKVMRYHSLIPDTTTFPNNLEITARTIQDNEIFGLRDKTYRIYGIQFHPESIGTEDGKPIIKNFLEACND